jgi:TFIIF-interacting CTD phosphatase-like protein
MFTENVDWSLYTFLQQHHLEKRDDLIYIELEKFRLWGIKRPGLDEFLNYCFRKFQTVSVWSAGMPDYVYAIVDFIFRDHRYPDNVLTRDHVRRETHFEKDDFYCKPLETFFNFHPEADKSNTILIDNRLENSKYDPHNIIHVPDFVPEQTVDGVYQDDDCFQVLVRWFESGLAQREDVRILNKKLFTQHFD